MAEPLPANPQGAGKVSERDTDAEVKDSQLVMENGRYFLCVPYVEKKKTREPSDRIVALDPGVRDFMTFFSQDCFGWLGHNVSIGYKGSASTVITSYFARRKRNARYGVPCEKQRTE